MVPTVYESLWGLSSLRINKWYLFRARGKNGVHNYPTNMGKTLVYRIRSWVSMLVAVGVRTSRIDTVAL